jgi:hypothetical protein
MSKIKEDWKQNLKDYLDGLPDNIQEVRKYSEPYFKLVDAGEGSIVVERERDIIEIWYK